VIAKWELGEGEPIRDQPTKVMALSDLFGKPPDEGFIVVFDPELESLNTSPERAQTYSLPSGGALSYLTLDSSERVQYGDGSFGIAP
jgi:hypothetical protein